MSLMIMIMKQLQILDFVCNQRYLFLASAVEKSIILYKVILKISTRYIIFSQLFHMHNDMLKIVKLRVF